MDRCPDCGTRRPYRGLSDDAIAELRAARAEGVRLVDLAERFGVSYTMVRRIVKGDDKVCKSCASKKSWSTPSEARARSNDALRKAAYANAKARRGVPLTPAHRAKLSLARQGKKPSLGMRHSEATKARWSAMKTGRSLNLTPEQVERRRAAAHRRWGSVPKPGPTRQQLADWAYQVIKRDHGRCVCCGTPKKGKKSIQAHHILSKSRHPSFALLLNNGVTLCSPCHRSEHSVNGTI